MNITGNTVKNGSTSSDNNLYLNGSYTVALSDSDGKTLSADSHIGVTTQASAPVKFATGVTDDIAAVRFCFDDDKKANEVYRIGTELYLGKDSSVTYEKYDNLYYYRTTTTDGLFYTDSSHKNSAGIKLLSEAVGHLNKGGNIYFMSSYSTSTDGERVVAPPDMGEIHIIRYSSSGTTFDGESMININGLFEVTCPHTNSTIIFDGNNVSTKNTGAGILWLWQTGSARIIGASPSCKNIKFVNSIITTGGGAAIRLGGGDNVIKNCIIEGNKKTSTDSEGSGAVLLLEDGGHANSTSMENCDLINNTSAKNAGALYVASGTHSFTNCNITGNKAESSSSINIYGGGVYIEGGGTNTLTNCSITNNTASSASASAYGGGVYIGGGGTNTLTNCSVTGNTASAAASSEVKAGGVYINGANTALFGKTNITDNTIKKGSTSSDSNLHCASNETAALNDGSGNALSTDSQIGVITSVAPTTSTPVQFATSASEEMKACFTPDDGNYIVKYNSSDKGLYLGVGYSNLYYKNNNFYSDSACSNSTGITKMSEAVASMTSSGKIHMLSQYASSADETVTVLSGRNVTVLRESSFTNASMFKITGGTFTVNAPKTNSSITFDGKSLTATANFNGGAFDVGGDSGKLELNGASDSTRNIILQNNRANKGAVWDSITNHGGAIYVESQGGGVTCNNCVMKGNASSMRGGAVCVVTGTNSFKNCTMDSNSKPYYGGAFASFGIDGMAKVVNTLENCSFTNNASIDYGGNLLLDDGTNTFTNCTISGGSTRQKGGGAYCTGATATFEKCSITNNSSSNWGGGINFLRTNTSNIKVSNTEISGNTASSNGGGIYVEIYNNETKGKITLTGATKITGNKVSSSANNVYIVKDQLIDVTGLATEQGAIGVKTAVTPTASTPVQFATNATEEMKACFTADGGNYMVKYKDSGLYLGVITTYSDLYYKEGEFYSDSACSNSTGITKMSEAVASMTSSAKIHMLSQYASSADETVTVLSGRNVTVLRESSFTNASMFKITGGTFKVNATDASSSITFDGNKDNVATSNPQGGAFYVLGDSTKFTLNGAEKSGGGKTITIQNNAVITQGGGIYLNGNGTHTLTNCSITGNTMSASYASGGGVFISGNGIYKLTDCSITGNTASSSGGGVYLNSNGTCTLLGTMNITGNTAKKGSDSSDNNLYLGGRFKITLSDGSGNALSTSSQIGVTTNTAPTSGTDIQFATNASEEMKACFTADNSDYYVDYKGSDNGLYLCVRTTYSDLYYKEGEFYSDSACSNSTGITKMSEAVASIDSSGIIHMMSQYASSADEETNVPAGKNIRVIRHKDFKDASMFSITGGTFKVNVTDATSSITFDGQKIKLTSAYNGGAFYVDGGNIKLNGTEKTVENQKEKTIIIKDNIISASSDYTSAYGGGFYIKGGINTLTNCSITGNKVSTSSDYTSAQGGGIFIRDGSNTLTNCSITSNIASDTSSYDSNAVGGGVYINSSGTNTLTNCSITGNKVSSTSSSSYSVYSTCQGGGVYIEGSGTRALTSCSIVDNTASVGGGVSIRGGTNTLENCSTTSNTASVGGGIFSDGGTNRLIGTMNITENTASDSSNNNLYLDNGCTVALSSGSKSLSTSSKIGITTETTPTSSTSVKFATGATSAMASCFTPDNSSYSVAYGSDGTLSLAVDNQKQITLSSSTPSIRITPEGYYTPQNSTTLNSFTGTYVLTGSYTGTSSSNCDVVFENTSTERKTIKVKIKDLSLKAYSWCSLGLLEGNGPMDIYITAEGTNSLQGYNHPAFNTNSDKVQGSNMYLNVKSGSTLLGASYTGTVSQRVAAEGINFYFNGTLLTSEQKAKNTTFTSTGYTQ